MVSERSTDTALRALVGGTEYLVGGSGGRGFCGLLVLDVSSNSISDVRAHSKNKYTAHSISRIICWEP